MKKNVITRRDCFKVVLLPATALSTRWLIGCAGDHTATGDAVQPSAQAGAAPSGGVTTPASASAGKPAASPLSSSAAPAAQGGSMASGSTAGAAPMAANGAAGASGAPPAAVSGGSGGASMASAGHVAAGSGAGGSLAQAGVSGGAPSTANVMWASGGTKAMQGNYPDPFAASTMGKACTLYPSQTLGPCYAQSPMMREDISDGLGGLPVRLSFLVVGKDGCTPITNASIDIWHSGSQGVYSAYATGTTCNPGKDDVKSKMFCRGVQITDESGRVNFSTVFPGWYTGRTIHVHFTVRLNGRETVTSQLYFEDALTDEILAQGDYKSRGKRDTNNAKDGIFKSGGATPEQVIMSTAKRADGVLHAWKVLTIG